GNKISNPPWVKFQSAGWVNFPSAPTAKGRISVRDLMLIARSRHQNLSRAKVAAKIRTCSVTLEITLFWTFDMGLRNRLTVIQNRVLKVVPEAVGMLGQEVIGGRFLGVGYGLF
ncbi:hypothetical protein AB2D30_33495, partial [Pseudomonas aeruginosa]